MFSIFRKPAPEQVRSEMLHEAELQLLNQQQLRDYHGAMASYLEQRVDKLRAAVAADAGAFVPKAVSK